MGREALLGYPNLARGCPPAQPFGSRPNLTIAGCDVGQTGADTLLQTAFDVLNMDLTAKCESRLELGGGKEWTPTIDWPSCKVMVPASSERRQGQKFTRFKRRDTAQPVARSRLAVDDSR